MIVIGITGKMYSGKTTVANMFRDLSDAEFGIHNSSLTRFAGPLKRIAKSMGWNGVKDEKGRRLLQILGTECMRECIDPQGWVKLWLADVTAAYEQVAEVEKPTFLVLVADCRYDNEAEAIRAWPNGYLFYVNSPDELRADRAKAAGEILTSTGHVSEKGVSDRFINAQLENSGDHANLRAQVTAQWQCILNHVQH